MKETLHKFKFYSNTIPFHWVIAIFGVKIAKKCILKCYNGYLLANRDAPLHCTATDCLVIYAGGVIIHWIPYFGTLQIVKHSTKITCARTTLTQNALMRSYGHNNNRDLCCCTRCNKKQIVMTTLNLYGGLSVGFTVICCVNSKCVAWRVLYLIDSFSRLIASSSSICS